MVGVSWGKPLNFLHSHTKLASLVRARVAAAVHGTDPFIAHRLSKKITGCSTSKCLNFFFSSNAQIEISINWCME